MLQQQMNTQNANIKQQSFKGCLPRKAIPTIGIEFAGKNIILENGNQLQAQIWDTSGDRLYKGITCNHFRNAVGALVVYDITNETTFENVVEWIESLKQFAEPNAVIMLVGNKLDLVENNQSARKVEYDVVQNLVQWLGVLYEEASTITGYNVALCFEKLFQAVISQMCNQKFQAPVQDFKSENQGSAELTKNQPQQQIITCSQCQEQYQDFIEHNCTQLQNTQINQQQEMIQQFQLMQLGANQNYNDIKRSQQINQMQSIQNKCKNGHLLNWCSRYNIPCNMCFKNQETIRYQCLQCKYFVCQKCLQPYFMNEKCPSQHSLVYIQRPNDGILCDFCNRSPYQEGWPVWSDRQCDFDVCQPCYMKCQQ